MAKTPLEATQAYDLLRNERRRQVIECLRSSPGRLSVGELAERIAERETGESPPPRNIRESAYNALHQIHLPKLDEWSVVDYDDQRKTVGLDEVRGVDRYMNVVTGYGLTWAEYYRTLGLLSLLTILATRLGLPLVSRVDLLLWVSGFLLAFAVSTATQLWSQRWWYYQRRLGD